MSRDLSTAGAKPKTRIDDHPERISSRMVGASGFASGPLAFCSASDLALWAAASLVERPLVRSTSYFPLENSE